MIRRKLWFKVVIMSITKIAKFSHGAGGYRDVSLRVSKSDTPYQTFKLKKVVNDAKIEAQKKRAISRARKVME